MPSAVQKRTTATNKAIKEYKTWSTKNQTDFVEDPLSIPANEKPTVWQECVQADSELPDEDTPLERVEPMDMDGDEEMSDVEVASSSAQTEEQEKKHDGIVEDMERTGNSLASMHDMLKKHTVNQRQVSAQLGGNRKRTLELDNEISLTVAPPETYDSEYESSDDEQQVGSKRPMEDDDEPVAPSPKKRKFEKVVEALNQPGKDREKEFVRRTKGEKAARALGERQGTLNLDKPAGFSAEPDSRKIQRSEKRSKKTGSQVKRETSSGEHPYSQFYSGENSVVSEVEEDMADVAMMTDQFDDEGYINFIKSVVATLYHELDQDNLAHVMKSSSFYASQVFPSPYHTKTVKDIDRACSDFLKPLKDILIEFVNALGEAKGINAKETMFEIVRYGIVEIYGSEEEAEAALAKRKGFGAFENYETRGSKVCNISNVRVQRKSTRRIVVSHTIKRQDLLIKEPKITSKKKKADPIESECVLRVIHRDMEDVVKIVYNASHFWQYTRAKLREVLQKYLQGEECTDDFKMRDLHKYVVEQDQDNTVELIKERYKDLCTALYVGTGEWRKLSAAESAQQGGDDDDMDDE